MTRPNNTKGLNGTTTKYEVVFETERVIGQKDGIPIVIFFEKSPYVLKKQVKYLLVGADGLEGIVQEYVDSYTKFLQTGKPPYIESYSIGKAVRIGEEDSNECTITEVDFVDNGLSGINIPTTPITYESGNCSPNGYYQGVSGGPIGIAMFPYGFFSSTITKKYISDTPIAEVGTFTDGGIVTNVDKSNPRYNGDTLIYDITETITKLDGTPYS